MSEGLTPVRVVALVTPGETCAPWLSDMAKNRVFEISPPACRHERVKRLEAIGGELCLDCGEPVVAAAGGNRTAQDVRLSSGHDPKPDTSRADAREADRPAAALPAASNFDNFDTAMRGWLTELAGIEREIDALDARKQAVRAQVREAIRNSDEDRYSYAGITASLTQGARSAKVVDRKLVPAEYLVTSVDTKKAGDVLRAGGAIPGLELSYADPVLIVKFPKEGAR